MNKTTLQRVLSRVNADCEKVEGFQHGIGKLSFADEYTPGEVKLWIPCGITLIDLALGGGLPIGRVVELFSENESEGKTTLAFHFMAQLQRYANGGGLGLWLEQETAMDKERAENGLGVDTGNLFIDCPHSVEDGFIRIWKWLDRMSEESECANQPKLIVWDTIAAASSRASAGGDMYADGIASKPRAIGEGLRGLVQKLYKCNATLLLLNQSYVNIRAKQTYIVYEQPGGKGLKFYSTIRFKVKRVGRAAEKKTIKSGKEGKNTQIGIVAEVEVVKNKIAPPYRSVNTAIIGYKGYNNPLSYAHFYADLKLEDMVQSAGAYYRLAGAEKCVTWDSIDSLQENPEVWAGICPHFYAKALELFPLPPDRRVDESTGWVTKIDGVDQFVSFGDGEREMSEGEVEVAGQKVKKSRAKKKKSKK
jgi:recombination protein RecA